MLRTGRPYHEHPEIPVSHDPPVALLGLQEGGCCPAGSHRPVLPPGHAACAAAYPRVRVVDHVRGAQAALERRGHSERADGDEFVEPLPRAPCGIWMLRLDPGGELLDRRPALASSFQGPQHRGSGQCVSPVTEIRAQRSGSRNTPGRKPTAVPRVRGGGAVRWTLELLGEKGPAWEAREQRTHGSFGNSIVALVQAGRTPVERACAVDPVGPVDPQLGGSGRVAGFAASRSLDVSRKFPSFDAEFPLSTYDGNRCCRLARAADRAVPIELGRSLAVIDSLSDALPWPAVKTTGLERSSPEIASACVAEAAGHVLPAAPGGTYLDGAERTGGCRGGRFPTPEASLRAPVRGIRTQDQTEGVMRGFELCGPRPR